MTMATFSAIAEIIAALGIIASLVFVGEQMRRNTRSVKGATYQSVISEVVSSTTAIAADKDLARIFFAGLANFDALDMAEQQRAGFLFTTIFRQFENIHYQWENGFMDQENRAGWENAISSYYNLPGFRKWWDIRGHIFSERFRDFLKESSDDLGEHEGGLVGLTSAPVEKAAQATD